MIQIETNTVQKIVNKANCKANFTQQINNNDKRYTVSVLSIYKGKNPSLDYNINLKIKEVLKNDTFDSIGGWDNKDCYYLDANVDFYSLDNAIYIAQQYNQIAIFDKLENKIINLNEL